MRHASSAPTTLGVIVNPHAFGVRRRRGLAGKLARIARHAIAVEETRNEVALEEATRRFAEAGVNLVAVCGGDGTNLMTLSALARAYGPDKLPRLALLRGGTVNTVAANLGVRGAPEELLERLVRAIADGHLEHRRQTLLQVNELYGFLFASAMGARFLEAYYDTPQPGPAWAALLALRTASSALVTGPFARRLFAPTPVALTVDGEALRDVVAARLFVASTVPDVGLGMRVAWRAESAPGRFHLVVSGLSTASMALQLPRVLRGEPLQGQPHVDRLALEVQARFEAPEAYTLDGELFRATEVRLRAGPLLELVGGPPPA